MLRNQTPDKEYETPDDFKCPISFKIMVDPVVSPSGRSYERANILTWVSLRPVDLFDSTIRLTPERLINNTALKFAVTEHQLFVENNLQDFYVKKCDEQIKKLTEYLKSINLHLQSLKKNGKTNFTLSSEIVWPFAMVCPLSFHFLTDPVITPDGITYEKPAIEEWLKENSTDPITQHDLTPSMLTPNLNLKDSATFFQDAKLDGSSRESFVTIRQLLTDIYAVNKQLQQAKEMQEFRQARLRGTLLFAFIGYTCAMMTDLFYETHTNHNDLGLSNGEVYQANYWMGQEIIKPVVTTGYTIGTQLFKHNHLEYTKENMNRCNSEKTNQHYSYYCKQVIENSMYMKRIDLIQQLFKSLDPSNFKEVVEYFIRTDDSEGISFLYKANPDILKLSSDCSLVGAARYGSAKVFKFLLSQKTSIQENDDAETVASKVLQVEPDFMTKFLETANDANLKNLIRYYREMLDILLKAGFPVNGLSNDGVYLKIALSDSEWCRYDPRDDRPPSREGIEFLIRNGARADLIKELSNYWLQYDDVESVKFLIDAGFLGNRPNEVKNKFLLNAFMFRSYKIIDLLWNHGIEDSFHLVNLVDADWIYSGDFLKVGLGYWKRTQDQNVFAIKTINKILNALIQKAAPEHDFEILMNKLTSMNRLFQEYDGRIISWDPPYGDLHIQTFAILINAGYVLETYHAIPEMVLEKIIDATNELDKLPAKFSDTEPRTKGLQSIFVLAVRNKCHNVVENLLKQIKIDNSTMTECRHVARKSHDFKMLRLLRSPQLKTPAQLNYAKFYRPVVPMHAHIQGKPMFHKFKKSWR